MNPTDLQKRTNQYGQIDYSNLQPGQYFDPSGKIVGPTPYVSQTNTTLPTQPATPAPASIPQQVNASATTQSTSNANLVPTIGSTTPAPGSAASVSIPAVSQTEKDRQAAIANLLKVNQAQADTNIDPNEIYNNQLRQFQDQINATNNVYNDQLNQARIAGLGRLGTNRAQQARGGLLGSDFGTAQENTIGAANDQVNQSIQDERLQAIAALQNQARAAAVNDLAVKTAAKKQGAQAVADYYNTTEPQLRASRATQVASALLSQGLDPSTLSPDQLAQLTSDWNLTQGDIAGAYNSQKISRATAAADLLKTQAEAAKADQTTVAQGGQLYTTDPLTGKTTLTGQAPPRPFAPPASVAEYEYAKANGYTGTYSQYQTEDANRKRAVTNVYNGTGGSGDPIVSGWVKSIQSGIAKISDITGNPTLKNLVIEGLSASGNSSSAGILSTTQQSLAELQDMVDKNKGFAGAVGAKGITSLFGLTSPIPGTPAADFRAKLEQVKNDVVLPNLTLLHGLGRVTDREFQALTHAVTSLSPDTSEAAFKQELANITKQINDKVSASGISDSSSSNAGSDTVTIQKPDGTTGVIPKSSLDAAIKLGAKQI